MIPIFGVTREQELALTNSSGHTQIASTAPAIHPDVKDTTGLVLFFDMPARTRPKHRARNDNRDRTTHGRQRGSRCGGNENELTKTYAFSEARHAKLDSHPGVFVRREQQHGKGKAGKQHSRGHAKQRRA